jgi:hypothetical protein
MIVSSDVHYWTKFSKTEVESLGDKILRKLNDKNHCASLVGRSFFFMSGGFDYSYTG